MAIKWPWSRKRNLPVNANPSNWFPFPFGVKSDSGEVVNKTTAMKLSAVYRCIATNSETVASLPKFIQDEKTKKNVDDQIYHLIHFQPNPLMTAFIYWETVMVHLQTEGNSYTIIERDRLNRPTRLNLVEEPALVDVYVIGGDLWYKIKGVMYPGTEILHFKSMSETGLKGRAPIRIAMDTIGLSLSAQKFGSKFFAHGTHQQGLIEFENSMTDDEWKAFQDHWKKSYAGMDSNNVPIIEGGGKWKDISIPLDQAQFILTREFQLNEICRIFNVPPHLVADLNKAHFANIEHMDMQYGKYTIKGYAKRMEQEIDIKLFPRSQWGKVGVKFSLEGLLRGDLKTRSEYYRTGIVTGYISRAEARAYENMEEGPEELKEFLKPLNMVESSENTDPDKHKE